MARRAAAYIRVSTEEQAHEGISLEAQRAQLTAYCTLRGMELVEIYCDAGVSAGTPLHKRPEGKRLIEHTMARGRVDAVIAYKLDRLFRNTLDCLQVLEQWERHQVALHLVDMGGQAIDTSSAMGRFFMTIMAGVAEMERNMTRDRTIMAMQHKRARGGVVGTPPLGFAPNAQGLLEPVEHEVAALERIKELSALGYSVRQIAATLNHEGYACRGRRWHKTSVHRWLSQQRLESASSLPAARDDDDQDEA